MQLPPLSSSSYTVIPEKSFHLCHTYTFSNTCAHTKAHATLHVRSHTHTHTFLFPQSSEHFQLAAPVSTRRQHNTVLQLPNLLFNAAYSVKPICFCTNHLLILLQSPPSHHGSFSPTYLIQNPCCATKKGRGGCCL